MLARGHRISRTNSPTRRDAKEIAQFQQKARGLLKEKAFPETLALLGANDRTHAVTIAMRRGFLDG
jgi:hypothetical protein